jgi:hypothetical protein
MMKKLLTIKPFQLFGLLVGAPMVFQFIFTGLNVMSVSSTMLLLSIAVMMILFVVVFFGWLYILGTNLHEKLPTSMPMNLTRFKLFLVIPVVYILLISIFIIRLIANGPTDEQPNPLIFAIIIPLHLFSMFCIFYCIYFSAKSLKAVELQRPVIFNDFVGEFFLFWFFPMGIWIIQPRINKLFEVENQ